VLSYAVPFVFDDMGLLCGSFVSCFWSHVLTLALLVFE
jgi:hypothetical protein